MSQKFCTQCQTIKPLDDFGTNKSKADGRASNCKKCRTTYQKTWYQENRQLHMSRVKISKGARIATLQAQVIAYLQTHPCVDCGETDIEVLDFDHRDPSEKLAGVSMLIGSGFSWERIMQEIDLCDVRCANDHRRRTGRQFGWFKARLAESMLD